MKKTDFLTDFLRYTYSSDIADSFCKKTVPLSILASIAISGVLTYLRSETLSFGLSILTLLLCATSCMAISLVVNVPLDNASRKFIKNKGIMLGYQSVDDFYDTNSILINADKLFPTGSVKLSGIKVFSDTKIDEALLEAASLTQHAGSVMKELFNDVIDGNKNILYPVENFSYDDSMGICGWINNKRVLFGNRELMTSHYIEGMPTKTKETEYTANGQEAIYLSISGNLAAIFIVDIKADKNVKEWIKQLRKRNICLIIKSVDACITLRKISTVFNIPEEMLRVIPNKLHKEFDEETSKTIRLSASMACTGKFTSLAQLINGTKNIYSASIIGLIFQTASILLGFGLALMLILPLDFSYDYMSASSLIVYNLICTAVTYFAVNMKQM
jgi:Cu+-exporting ATPase